MSDQLPPGPWVKSECALHNFHVRAANGKNVARAFRHSVADLLIRAERWADTTPIDEAWLRSVGRHELTRAGWDSWVLPAVAMPETELMQVIRLMSFGDGDWCVEIMQHVAGSDLEDHWPEAIGRTLTTRGQLRMLCESLGAPLTEPEQN